MFTKSAGVPPVPGTTLVHVSMMNFQKPCGYTAVYARELFSKRYLNASTNAEKAAEWLRLLG